ncbi:MAG: aldo/keto reductase [Gammaproteobacteria bacterium]|nr:aldo/keto reductase [Gammaproteobacteria bacterium]
MKTRWGILATGRIAHTFAGAVEASATATLTAVGSRTKESAQAFVDRWQGAKPHGSYQELLDDADVDAIYIAPPHPQHAEWTIKALEAGKAVLCEKPMGLNYPQVMAMVDAADPSGGFLMEAFMYRAHPMTGRIVELVQGGAIGEVRHIEASFGFNAPYRPQSRLYANELGGGGIMDVGCYPVSMSRLIAAAAAGVPPGEEEPVDVQGSATFAETGVDACAAAVLRFPSGIVAQVATAVTVGLQNRVVVSGSQGAIHIAEPWRCADENGDWSFELVRGDGQSETVSGNSAPLYVHEVEAVSEALASGGTESPCMSWADSLGNARTLDAWRRSIGLVFDQERPERQTVPVHGRPLRVTRGETRSMQHGAVRGIDKPISRLVMGCDNQPDIAHASVMFDHFFEQGGNTFDTAHIYGGGRMESLLGAWMANRGVRDEVVVIGKGAHTPANFPGRVAPQLDVSLERLATDHVDLYFLHRDNTDVDVSEWMDVLNRECDAGRITAFGASNWSLARVQEANAYAERSGLKPFVAVSNNFSLARMVDPVWPGCIAASTPSFRAWLAAEQMALFPWSSQARGFFTPRFDAVQAEAPAAAVLTGNQPSDAEMRRCWFAEDNFARRERAVALAKERGVEPIVVALAWVLNQPFPCFPLVGPRQLSETRSSLKALDIALDAQQMEWLYGKA